MSISADHNINHYKASIHLQDLADLLKTVDENALVAITDPTGEITHVNDMFCRVTKYTQEELIGQNHRVLSSGCHAEAFWKNLWNTILAGRVWKGEIKNRAKDGSSFWVEVRDDNYTCASVPTTSGRLT